MDINLSDQEIDDICSGLRQHAAKARHLARMGLKVNFKPNGRPLVNRMHYNMVTGQAAAAANMPLPAAWSARR